MRRTLGTVMCVAVVGLLAPAVARAHCDAMDGPVVKAARAALESRDVAGVLPWVHADREPEVRAAFDRALEVRKVGGPARELADTWFFETLVRIHRAGEGAAFDGLKPAGQIEPLIAAVDQTLEAGALDPLLNKVTTHVGESVRTRYDRAREAKAHAGESVEAGRRFVAAYVEYMHHVEGLHLAAMGPAARHAAEPAAPHGH